MNFHKSYIKLCGQEAGNDITRHVTGETNGALIPPAEELKVFMLLAETWHAGKQHFYTFV